MGTLFAPEEKKLGQKIEKKGGKNTARRGISGSP